MLLHFACMEALLRRCALWRKCSRSRLRERAASEVSES